VGAYNERQLNSKSSIHRFNTPPPRSRVTVGADRRNQIVTAIAPEIHNFTGDDLPSYPQPAALALDTGTITRQIDSLPGGAAIGRSVWQQRSSDIGGIGVSLATGT